MTYVNFVKTVYLFSYECFRLAVETRALISLTHPVSYMCVTSRVYMEHLSPLFEIASIIITV